MIIKNDIEYHRKNNYHLIIDRNNSIERMEEKICDITWNRKIHLKTHMPLFIIYLSVR